MPSENASATALAAFSKVKKDKAKKKNGKLVCTHRWASILLAYKVKEADLPDCIRELQGSGE